MNRKNKIMIVAMLCLPYTLVAAQPQMIVMGGAI